MPLEGVSVPRKVAVCASPDGLNPDPQITEEILRAADKLEAAGWAVANVDLPPLRTAMDNQLMLWMAEMHQGASALVALEKDPDASLVYDRISARCPQYSVDNLMKVLQTRALLTRQWRVFLETYPLVLCPVSGQLPFDDLKDLESQLDFDAIIEAQMLQIGLPFMGLPCLSVATGYSSDRPVGVQLVAGPFREDILLAAGDIIGQTIPVVTPKF
jgi:amidase